MSTTLTAVEVDANEQKPASKKRLEDDDSTVNPMVCGDVIDLCASDDDDDESAASAVPAAVRKKRRREQQQKQPPRTDVDAIEIDIGDSNRGKSSTFVDPSASYRQVLGPLRFRFVESLGHHAYGKQKQNPMLNVGKIFKELVEYQLNLPVEVSSSIFVRVVESRLDLLRVLITGPEDTPYYNGFFVFDIQLTDYPLRPPIVKLLTTGGGRVRFNPNLYHCGKVCLSLLGTWTGPGWIANQSTLLQVLVSIQGLILVAEPYYNEPGFAESGKTNYHKQQSEVYNRTIRKHTLTHAMDKFLMQACSYNSVEYPEFLDVMIQHYIQRADSIRKQLDDWVALDAAAPAPCPRESAYDPFSASFLMGFTGGPAFRNVDTGGSISLADVAARIRINLDMLVSKYEGEKVASTSASAAGATKRAAPVVLTID